MDKQTKLILGLGLVAAGGYLLWKQGQRKKSFASVGQREQLSFVGAINSPQEMAGNHELMNYTGSQVGDRQLTSFVGAIDSPEKLTGPVGRIGSSEFGSFTGDAGERHNMGSPKFGQFVGSMNRPEDLAGPQRLMGTNQFGSFTGNAGKRVRTGSGTFGQFVGAIESPQEMVGDKQLLEYVGTRNPVGRRVRATGGKRRMAGGSVEVRQSKFNAAGGGFFDVQQKWMHMAGDQGFFDVQDSGWPA